MSRRTRLKMRRSGDHYGLGTSHHQQYASSTSTFPKSYSAIGKPIKFPSLNAVPFYNQGKLTFYGTIQDLLQKSTLLLTNQTNLIHTVNIGIKGEQTQKMSQLNTGIFAMSMILCCISYVFTKSFYREKFHTKYTTPFVVYKQLTTFMKTLPSLKKLTITIQDNDFSTYKSQYLDQQLSKLKLKSVTIRNLSYCINTEQRSFVQEFKMIAQDKKTQLIFVWQKECIKVNFRQQMEEEQINLSCNNNDDFMCDEIG